MIQLKNDQRNHKQEFADRMNDLVGDANEREALVDGFDQKMLILQNQLQNEAKKQEDLLAERLARRKLRGKEVMGELGRKLEEKEERLEQLDEERYNL